VVININNNNQLFIIFPGWDRNP